MKGPYTGYWKIRNPEKKLKNKIKNPIIADSNT